MKNILNSQNHLKKNKAEGFILPNFKAYDTAPAIKTCGPSRDRDTWNVTRSPETNTHL